MISKEQTKMAKEIFKKYNYVMTTCELTNEKLYYADIKRLLNEKKIEMIKSKELLPLTGYIHGGCSPIGMKKFFKTTIHSTAENYDTIMFSAGKIGYQVETSLNSLKKVIRFDLEDIAD